ncbi:hypothetical protein ILUMI_20560 [Ignelater luminosus]|uniref:COX assembly mitochondrial protein n=1 Tax=Ignelater luminosus TaxID=2038154 RepID=A0A8K0CJH5_IGNLU|nr:hypothetical protein ILUMI_20560 [Ignelater luminosus]
MHTDLSPHLHTKECNTLIDLLKQCHEDHPFRKFLGYCNSIDQQVVMCLKSERLARRQKNYEKSLEFKRKLREKAQSNMA